MVWLRSISRRRSPLTKTDLQKGYEAGKRAGRLEMLRELLEDIGTGKWILSGETDIKEVLRKYIRDWLSVEENS